MSAEAATAPQRREWRSGELAVILLLPIALVNAVGFILPVLNLGRYSFNRARIGGGIEQVFTLENWVALSRDKFYLDIVVNSVVVSLGITFVTLVLS